MDQQPVPQTYDIQINKEDKKPPYWIIILIPLALILAIAGYFITKNSTLVQPANKLPESSTTMLPLDPLAPDIISYGVFYFVKGQITDIEKGSAGLNLKTNMQSLPSFLVDDRTLIHFFTPDQNFTQTTSSSLQKGQNIRVSIVYDARKDGMPIVKGVLIEVDKVPKDIQSTPSAQFDN